LLSDIERITDEVRGKGIWWEVLAFSCLPYQNVKYIVRKWLICKS
jgi:hypothetical protein